MIPIPADAEQALCHNPTVLSFAIAFINTTFLPREKSDVTNQIF
jgi:hypothetical protein